jgi:hypothetical protein
VDAVLAQSATTCVAMIVDSSDLIQAETVHENENVRLGSSHLMAGVRTKTGIVRVVFFAYSA